MTERLDLRDPARVLVGDCVEVMKRLPANSIDAIVTDPPAGISFMGKNWDHDRGGRLQWIAWMTTVMSECMRVLKPGGHMFVWALPRTAHWTATAIEDAGFDVRDICTHVFGTGMPKSLNVSKAIDKTAGAEREVVGVLTYGDGHVQNSGESIGYGGSDPGVDRRILTAPATDAARTWQGWGTGLKPAAEFWILARSPFSERTVATNVLEHGTGAVNVDACRIEGGPRPLLRNSGRPDPNGAGFGAKYGSAAIGTTTTGRWPPNLLLSHTAECVEVGTRRVRTGTAVEPSDGTKGGIYHADMPHLGRAQDGTETVSAWRCVEGCPVRMLDEQAGERGGAAPASGPTFWGWTPAGVAFGARGGALTPPPFYGDTGGPSRFFPTFEPDISNPMLYCSKASTSERKLPDGLRHSHPTTKPVALMRWLLRLVTPPDGLVLDPFLGSGSTAVAAIQEGMRWVGIEQSEEYAEIARQRILLRSDGELREGIKRARKAMDSGDTGLAAYLLDETVAGE